MSVYRQAMLGNVQLLQGEQTTRLSASTETNTVLKVQAAAKLNIQMLQMKHGCFNNPRNRCNVSCHRVFSLTWPASMQICWNKRKRLHEKSVHLPQDWFGTPTWLPFYCFGTPIWQPRRHVKTHYTHERISSEVKGTLPKTLKNYLLQHMQTPEKKRKIRHYLHEKQETGYFYVSQKIF